jgi:hypothetical protein
MALIGRKCIVKISGTSAALTNEATTADGTRTTYQITNTAKRALDPTASQTVQTSPDGTTWTTISTGFTLNRLEGKVVFGSAQAAGTQVRISSGSYLPLSIAGEANDFKYTIEADNQDVTTFNTDYIKRKQGQKDASASLSGFYVDRTFYDKLTAGALCVLEFWRDNSNIDMKMWGIIPKDEISASPDGMVEESVDFEGSADIDGRVVSAL